MGLSNVARRRAALAASSWRRLARFWPSAKVWVLGEKRRFAAGCGRRGVGEAAARLGTVDARYQL